MAYDDGMVLYRKFKQMKFRQDAKLAIQRKTTGEQFIGKSGSSPGKRIGLENHVHYGADRPVIAFQ